MSLRSISIARSTRWIAARVSARSISQTLQIAEVVSPTAAPSPIVMAVLPSGTPLTTLPTITPMQVSVPLNPFDIKYRREIERTSSRPRSRLNRAQSTWPHTSLPSLPGPLAPTDDVVDRVNHSPEGLDALLDGLVVEGVAVDLGHLPHERHQRRVIMVQHVENEPLDGSGGHTACSRRWVVSPAGLLTRL